MANDIKTIDIQNKAAFQKATKEGQATLMYLDKAFDNKKYKDASFILKKLIISDDGSSRLHLWFALLSVQDGTYLIKPFELPDSFSRYKNKAIQATKEEIEDWAIILDNKMYGAYTIRLQRSKLKTEEEKKNFDAYMGVEQYMTQLP